MFVFSFVLITLALVTYLKNVQVVRNVYDATEKTRDQLESRVKAFSEAVKYFEALQGLTPDLLYYLRTSLDSLVALRTYHRQKYNSDFSMTTHLGTNIVENYFSIIRGKVHFPNLEEFATCATSAWMEFVKRNCVDYDYPFPEGPTSKCYANTHGIRFSLKDTGLLKPSERKGKLRSLKYSCFYYEVIHHAFFVGHQTLEPQRTRRNACSFAPFMVQTEKSQPFASPIKALLLNIS